MSHPTIPSTARASLWSEFLTYDAVRNVLPEIAERGVGLFLAVPPDRVAGVGVLVKEAAQLGVETRLWVLLEKEDGYWPSKWNHVAFKEQLNRVRDALDGPPDWIIFDLEPAAHLLGRLSSALSCGRLRAAHSILKEAALSASLQHSEEAYGRQIADLLKEGTKAMAVTLPLILDGGRKLENALGIPVSGVAWDEVSFMVYRPEFERLAGRLGADIVFRYARAARARFGNRAALALGEVGTIGYPGPTPGYTDPANLVADIAAARAGGVANLHIFSLDGILEQGGLARWLHLPEALRPRSRVKAGLIRTAIRQASRLLPRA